MAILHARPRVLWPELHVHCYQVHVERCLACEAVGSVWLHLDCSGEFTVHSSQFTVHSSQFTVHSSQLAVGSWRATRENLPRMGDRRLIKDMSRSVDRCRSDELQTADRKLRTVNKTGSGWAKGGPWQVISRIYNDREGGRNESTTRRSTK